jgi:hypothetical protein
VEFEKKFDEATKDQTEEKANATNKRRERQGGALPD